MFSDTERKLREDICQVAKMMYARENISGMLALREKMGMNLPSDANLLKD